MRLFYLLIGLFLFTSCGSGPSYISNNNISKPVCDAKCIEKKGIARARQIEADNRAGLSCTMPEEKYWSKLFSCNEDGDRYDSYFNKLGWSEERGRISCIPTKCSTIEYNENSPWPRGILCLAKPSLTERISDWWNSDNSSKKTPKVKTSPKYKPSVPKTTTTTCDYDPFGKLVCKTRSY